MTTDLPFLWNSVDSLCISVTSVTNYISEGPPLEGNIFSILCVYFGNCMWLLPESYDWANFIWSNGKIPRLCWWMYRLVMSLFKSLVISWKGASMNCLFSPCMWGPREKTWTVKMARSCGDAYNTHSFPLVEGRFPFKDAMIIFYFLWFHKFLFF